MATLESALAAGGRGAVKRCAASLGVSGSAISSWRTGKTEPSGEHTLALAQALVPYAV